MKLSDFVGTTHEHIGKVLNGVQVLGSIDNVGKIIKRQRISDVIFAPQALSYTQILSVIGRSREQAVAFHLVPTTMEVIVGKASVDSLENLPLVQIAYNIDKPFNRLTKRVFDLVFSGLLLITVYPIFRLFSKKEKSESNSFLDGLSNVLSGRMSFVGPPVKLQAEKPVNGSLFLGKPGICGLVQLQQDGTLTDDEINQYCLYYARNQSILLDFEILIKTWSRFRAWQKENKEK